MSLKGAGKTLVRAPQQFKQKFNIGDITKDAVYIDAERRFAELETETKKLHDESKKYFDAIKGMLNHQIEFSQAIQEIYKPISGRVSDPNSLIPEGNPEGIRACEEYENIVRDLLATLQPELEMIEQRVIAPADQLLEVIKVVRKVSAKRDHKQLDYDRHRSALKRLQDKKEKTLKDEKALFNAENAVEQATQDYEYFNNLLKDELPKLFALEAEFIRPLFQSFYYMQLNVFYTLHEKMQAINIGYFDLTLDIEEAFEAKRGDVKEQAELLSIVHFKTTGGVKSVRGSAVSKYGAKAKEAEASKSKYGRNSAVSNPEDGLTNPPPPYSPVSSTPTSPALGGLGKVKPPPPKPKPSRLSGAPQTETVTALYDYEAQAEGDLSFTTGDVIEIISRTQNENEWWSGEGEWETRTVSRQLRTAELDAATVAADGNNS